MKIFVRIAVVAGLCGCGPAPVATPKKAQDQGTATLAPPVGRLTDASIPTRYTLRFTIDPEKPTFRGSVVIDVDVKESLTTFWLHSRGLTVERASFEGAYGTINLVPTVGDTDDEFLALDARRNIEPGSGLLRIEYTGSFQDQSGIFRQEFEGNWYVFTDFEPMDARTAFPCFDDPRFRVPFAIEVDSPEGNRIFSNAPEVDEESLSDGQRRVRFDQTLPLPTYLAAIAVGPFDTIEDYSQKLPIRIIAPKGHQEEGRFVLKHVRQWLAYLEEYLAVPMPYPKIDFVAVPRFSGAMENPGLITVTAGILLTGEGEGDAAEWRAAGVVAHELAHLWFGDLLSLEYWDSVWLNESFATWLSDKVLADFRPARKGDVLDLADKRSAYEIDHGLSGRVVAGPIGKENPISALFDAITYRKGGAFLTMLEGFVGEEAMQRVVRLYASRYANQSVRTKDLLQVFSEALEPDLTGVFESFLGQSGVPVVGTQVTCAREVIVSFEQRRYLDLDSALRATAAERRRLWTLPVCVRYGTSTGNHRQCILLESAITLIKLPTTECPTWFLPNDGDTGYYHYELEPSWFRRLQDKAALSEREELALIQNVSAAWHGGTLSLADVVPLLAGFVGTDSVHVQDALLFLLYKVDSSLVGAQDRGGFERTIRSWLDWRIPVKKLDQNSKQREERQLQNGLWSLVGDLGAHPKVRDAANQWVRRWLHSPSPIRYERLRVLLHLAAIDGGESLFEEYRDALKRGKNPWMEEIFLASLLSFRDPAILRRSLEFVDERLFLPGVAGALVQGMARPSQREVILNFLADKGRTWLGSHEEEMVHLVNRVLSLWCTDEAQKELARLVPRAWHAQISVRGCPVFASRLGREAGDVFVKKRDLSHPQMQ